MSSLEWWAVDESQEGVPCRLPCCGQIKRLSSPVTSEYQCSTCGDSCPLPRGPPSRDYVPSADLKWTGATCTSARHIHAKNGPKAATIEDFAAVISSPQAPRLLPLNTTLQTQARPESPRGFLVWRAATAGCTARCGTIELPDRGVLLLAGRGVHFHGTTFKGGVVMCAGADYSGSFTNCNFRSTAVYAVHAAAVTLRGCITDDTHPGLTLSGGATHATLSDCVFHNCHTSIIVDAGAAARALDCSMLSTACAVTINGRGSSVVLHSCAAVGGFDGSIGKTGVATAGGTMQLRECLFTTFFSAVTASLSTAAIEAHGLEVTDVVRGIVSTGGARVLVRDCDFRLTRESTSTIALKASGVGRDAAADAGPACMVIERSEVHASVDTARGVVVDDGSAVSASLSVFKCTIEAVTVGCNRGSGSAALMYCTATSPHIGLLGHSSAKVRLEGGFYEGGTTACGVSSDAKLTAVDCEFRSRGVVAGCGVVGVTGGAHAWLHRCDVHTGVVGVCAVGGTVVATGTAVHDIQLLLTVSPTAGGCCHEPGAYKGGSGFACSDGWVTVRGGSVRRCVIGLEAENRRGTSGAVTLDGVEFTDCGTGADVEHDIVLDVKRCEFHGLRREGRGSPALREAVRRMFCCSSDCGVALRSSHATVEHCSFEGFSSGIKADSQHEAVVRHCSVFVTKDGGACVLACGKIALEDCAFSGLTGKPVEEMHTFGVHAVEGAACAIRRCTFDGISGDAVEAEGRCCVTVVDSRVTGGSARGLVVTGDADLAAQDCRIEGVHTAVGVNMCGGKFTAKRVTMRSSYINVHLPSVREQDGRRTVVKLVDSVLTGSVTSVCIADAFAELVFLRCQISDCDTGVVLGGPLNARMKGTRISRCKTGVSVGDVMMIEPDPCPVCGEFGQQAFQRAYQSLFGQRGQPPREGRCAHEGAIARLSMVDSELVECRQLGVRVNLHGRLDAAGVTAHRCRTAYFNEYMNTDDRSKFVRCKAVGCQIPAQGAQQVLMGDRMLPVHVALPGIEVVPASGDGG